MTLIYTICDACGDTVQSDGIGTGYGRDNLDRRICYACCAVSAVKHMRETGRGTLYLVVGAVTNWPGTLRIKIGLVRVGRHNKARKRRDFWFTLDGEPWHGTQYGENSDLAYCRRVKYRT